MPSSKPDPEEAEVNAELTAAHAEHAVETAAAAERDLAEATKERPGSRLCPHDNAEMTQHGSGNPAKAGAWHCNTCGCCFHGKALREGHSGCPAVAAPAQ